jgi:anaerobic selenocysteine-containing dehydrogenase
MADHRWALGPQRLEAFARGVARALGVAVNGEAAAPGVDQRAVVAVARDLQNHRGRGIVIAGEQQPAVLHALAHAMNQVLGNAGATVIHIEPVEAQPVDHGESMHELGRAMEAGAVQTLIVLGGNPAYTAPADAQFGARLARVPFTVHLSLYENETSALCRWRVPEAHYLESWSDVRAFDGSASIIQPLIAPLYGGRTAHELVSALLGRGKYRRSFPQPLLVAAKANGCRAAQRALKWSSARTRVCSTAASPTTAGFKSCPSRLAKSLGTTLSY